MSDKENGGTAFPVLHMIDGNWTKEPIPAFRGMTLRDYFAAKLPSDEIQDITYKNLSRDAQELLTGMKYPIEPPATHRGAMPPAEHRLACVRFHIAVNAAIRYMAADAMLKERSK